MPLGISRSHSPPLPPNATYHHPIIALKILPSAKLFLAGSKLTGILEVTCQERNSVALGQLAIEFAGTEELKLVDHTAQSSLHGPHKCIFQGPALPPSNAVASSEAPIAGHYYTALRGRTKFPFTFPLPSHLPSSTNFDGRARVSYALKATCQVLTIQSRQNVLVTKSIPIRIVERLVDWNDAQYHEPLEVRGEQAAGGGVGVWAEAKIDKRLYYHQNSSTPNDGLIPVLLTVKNNSRRMLSGGINAKICRKLVLPNQPSTSLDPSRIQVVRNCSFRGLEYEFPPASGQAKTVKLSCQLPNSRQDDDQHQDSSCISVKGTKLFSLSMFLRIEIELGALSDDLVVDLPIHVAHPSSLPNELLIRNATPLTIDHDRSSNPLSIAHLGEPQSSGRVSRNTSRSSSPHPPSLQPGNISRSASPRLSLNITGDWGLPSSASAPPSPIRSPHFSPLPTPRHSPLPSPRFSSPLPFSPSSTVPNHHPSEASVISPATYFSPAASWSNPAALPYAIDRVPVAPTPAPGFYPTASQHDFPTYPLQSHPAHPIPSQDLPSQVPPSDPPYPPHPISQPVFSPPTTPWRRQTVSTSSNFDPSASYPSSTPQPNLSYQPIPQASTQTSPFSIHSRPHPPTYSQEPFHHPNPQGVDTSYSLRSSWRTRHQSLPVAPAPPPHYSHHLSNEHEGQNLSDNSSGLSRRPSNSSRRTSEPISNSPWPNGHPHPPLNAGPTTPRKRALPKPPQACDLSETSVPHSFHSQNGLNTTQDQPHHNSTLPSQDPLNSGQHSRLETIGEASESRPGTLSGKQVSRDILNVLATWDNPQDSDQDDFRPPQSRRATRVVSHPRSMRPRRSDGSDSVQALEDVVSKEDDRRSIDERSPAAGPSPDRNSCPSEQQMSLDRSSSLNPRQASPSILDHTPQSPGHNSKARPSDSSSRHPEPALSAVRERLSPSPSPQKSQPSHPTGLANLAQFLTRATSTEPPRTSSAPGADPNSRNSSLDQRRDEKPDLHSKDEKPTHAIGPNYSGSALRIKSTGISYGEAFVDAVPSPTCANANSAPEPKSVTSIHADKSAWKPPPALTNQPSDTPRTSIVGQIDLPNNSPSDEPLIARESVAPDALFPQFQLDPLPSVKEERDSAPQGSLEKIPPNLIASSDSKSSSASQPPRHPTPLSIPSDSPLVKKKSSRSPKKVAQPKKQTGAAAATQSLSDIQTTPVPPPHLVSNDRKSMSPSPQTTIVERLRSRNEEATAALKAAEQLKAHDDPAINKMHDALTTAVHEVLSRPYEAGIMNHNAGRLGSDGKIHLLEKTASARPVEDPTRAHASSSPTQPLNFRRSLPTPAARQPSSVSTHHPHTTTEFSSTVSKVDSVTAPLVPRLSAIPKSTSPLSIKGSGSYNASDPIPHRPLPISLGNSRNIRTSGVSLSPVSDLTSFKPLSSTSTYASHMLSQTRASSQTIRDPLVVIEPERQRSEYLHLGDRSKISTAGTACSPTSPTNLARKSRIKRLSSSTYTPSDLPNGSTVTGYGGTRDELSKITRVPGGWNDEESNEIEAELMEALRQTNLAVQKATSHRLSTPQFSKSPSLNRSLILSNLLSTSDTRRSSLGRESLDADRLRASISLMGGNRQDRYDRRTSIDRNLYGAGRGGQALDGPQADESSKEMAYDEDQPIPLTTGEYKSMRGGRGGRVSSVVGQWAKLTAADEPVTSVLRKDSEASSRSSWALESNRNKSLSKELISTRGISIKPKNSNHSTGYSITGLLSRNSSLASQQSSSSTIRLAHHNQPDSKNDDDGHPREVNDPSSSHLPPVPKFNLPGLISPSAARTLPPIPRPITATTTTTTTTTMAANESHPRVKQDRNSNPIGYRNLANRLSGTTIMNPSVSQSSPSISSLNSLRQQFGHRSKPTMTTTTTTSSSSSSSSRSSSTSSFTSSTCSSDRIQKLNAGGRPHLGMTSGTSGAHSPAQDRLDRTQRRHSSLLHQLHGLHTSRHHPTSTTSGTGGGGISELVRRWES